MRIAVTLALLIVLALAGLWVLGSGWLGTHWGPGVVTSTPVPERAVAVRRLAQRQAARAAGVASDKQILFGDLHVHTTYSVDAFLMALPQAGGDGAHPVADACDFARYCSSLDFWSVNDHALGLTPRRWRETVESIRQCNAVAGDTQTPDTTAFLGWEWTQIGSTPENHYGHKNIVLRDLEDDRIPTRPIMAGIPGGGGALLSGSLPSPFLMGLVPLRLRTRESLDLVRYLRDTASAPVCPDDVPIHELPLDCREVARTPAELFAKLDHWGHEALVIPHGTTWGFYTPPGSSWDKQLTSGNHDPERQKLVEIFSGHGNSEEYRSFRAVAFDEQGKARCPEPTTDYLPTCWRAGEIIRERCKAAGEPRSVCAERAEEARQNFIDAGIAGHLTVRASTLAEWQDSGQCKTCFLPAFNYRPASSVQYMLSLGAFDGEGDPRRFRFGFLGSSDNHSARSGNGYKEFARSVMTESRFNPLPTRSEEPPTPYSIPYEPAGRNFFNIRETERQASFFLTGGLVATHANGRDRTAIWDSLSRREVYGTSGPRILLWFDLMNAPSGPLPMGSETVMSETPVFVVRAVGSYEQQAGCPRYATSALAPERLDRLCRSQCYNPSDQRRPIARIEVVRIRPQRTPGEPVADLIDDPWKVHWCSELRPEGCALRFSDPDFQEGGRETLYYVRAIETPSLAVNAGGLRCEYDARGRCVEVRPCVGVPADDDCLGMNEERAWSSPIWVGHRAPAP